MATKLETFTCVEASTAHITKEDNDLLQKEEKSGIVSYEFAYGYFIYLSPEETRESIKEKGYSDAFIDLYMVARNTGAKYLQLDQDGVVYSRKQKFDW